MIKNINQQVNIAFNRLCVPALLEATPHFQLPRKEILYFKSEIFEISNVYYLVMFREAF